MHNTDSPSELGGALEVGALVLGRFEEVVGLEQRTFFSVFFSAGPAAANEWRAS